ncbi:restriction endonuclease subunit S [Enterococcus sp. 5B3_DIV0040]|uniref:restriction endonuclease subunit S n=1 Tax=Enterococcus sp. 5B3_DIV0040 TaxID=1834182 RepID=UPI000A32F337|nr:restriction endonuclease subunit S [Enterococcus sp. 5B3_DIV0040]OTO05386.1 hypothetical protein A5883_002379 [Enterococcus sp. 5B3_DIV0040]
MIDTKALREKVLDLAIRGKLVPQDPNDEPATVLLERIREQKKQMVKEGKLKAKDIKNDTIIFKGDDNLHYEQFTDGTVKCIEDELPFDLPEGWAWCRLRNLFLVGSAKRVLQSEWKSKGIPFYRAREIVKLANDGYVNNDLFISEEHYRNLKETYGVPAAGDLMVTGVGTIGKVYVVKERDTFYYKDASVLCFENKYSGIVSEYAKLMIDSPLLQSQIHTKTYGNTVDTITITTANEYLCALPPVAEQQRIVDSVNNTISLIASLESNYQDISAMTIILKSKVLDLAIQGKLVPQDPNDEPASVLLERIRAEKEELIKAGKIKRDKKESIIFKGDDNSYYQDLPEMWELVNFKDCATLISGRDLNKNEYNAESIGIPYITGASNFINGNILINRWTTVPKTISEVNDILITCKGTVGELAINKYGNIHIARQIMAIRVYKNINLEYIKLFLESIVMEIKKTANGLIPGISRDDMLSLNIPLPPLAEQKRIVDEIKKIFATLDDIATQVA